MPFSREVRGLIKSTSSPAQPIISPLELCAINKSLSALKLFPYRLRKSAYYNSLVYVVVSSNLEMERKNKQNGHISYHLISFQCLLLRRTKLNFRSTFTSPTIIFSDLFRIKIFYRDDLSTYQNASAKNLPAS